MSATPSKNSEARLMNRDDFVRSALDGKVAAIQGYDAILWKIRAGYVAVLYSGLTLLLGEKIESLPDVAGDAVLSVTLFLLILGFSISAFLLDLSYKRKKIRVVVAHDQLMDLALKDATDKSIEGLWHISGETSLERLDSKLASQYKQKLVWNLWRVLVPLYCVTPVLAILTWIFARRW